MSKEYGTQREKIITEFEQKTDNEGKDNAKALREVKEELEFDDGYIQEIYEKFIAEDLEPRTDLQKAVIDVYDDHPAWSYIRIAEEVTKRTGMDVSDSTVGDYSTRFRNDVRRYPETYDSSGYGDNDDENESPELQEMNPVSSDYVEDRVESFITFSLEEDDAFELARFLVQHEEMEELAKEIMRQYS